MTIQVLPATTGSSKYQTTEFNIVSLDATSVTEICMETGQGRLAAGGKDT